MLMFLWFAAVDYFCIYVKKFVNLVSSVPEEIMS